MLHPIILNTHIKLWQIKIKRETVFVFAFFIFSTFKLFLVGELVPENGSNVVSKLIKSAKDRINELKPEEPETEPEENPDENQFSILDGEEDGEELNDSADSESKVVTIENTEEITVEDGFSPLDGENPANAPEISDDDGTRVTEKEPETEDNKIEHITHKAEDDTSYVRGEDDLPTADENAEDTVENTENSEPV